jgi:hypothetical protein
MLKGTNKNAFFFHSVKTWLLLFSVVAGCLTKRGSGITIFEIPIVEIFPIDSWWVSWGKRAVVLK